MKNLSNTIEFFLSDVKEVLDNATWDYEASDPNANYEDTEKAISYLETQKFSIKKIKEALENEWRDFRTDLRSCDPRFPEGITTHDEAVMLAAMTIANKLGFDRISRFKYDYYPGSYLGLNSKKWIINETVSLTIQK